MLATFLQGTQLVLVYSAIGVAMLVIGALWCNFVMTRGFPLRKELFEDDNPAAGLVVGHFLLALALVIAACLLGDRQADRLGQDLVLTLLYFLVALLLFTIARLVYKAVMRAALKVDLDDEVFVQNNLAAARVEGSVYLALGLILAAAVY